MKRLLKYSLFVVLTANLLVGCASKPDETALYVRADFSFWQVNDKYRFVLEDESLIAKTQAKLRYDGQLYYFKIADKSWSNSMNCGYAHSHQASVVFDTWLPVDCNYSEGEFTITPMNKAFILKLTEDALVTFKIRLEAGKPVALMVSKGKSN